MACKDGKTRENCPTLLKDGFNIKAINGVPFGNCRGCGDPLTREEIGALSSKLAPPPRRAPNVQILKRKGFSRKQIASAQTAHSDAMAKASAPKGGA